MSFRVHAGEVLGIAGLMGAGRTEVLETIFGAANGRWQGEVFISGKNVKFNHPSEACNAGLVMVPEDRKRLGVFENFNINENISLCSLSRTIRYGFLNRQAEEELVAEAIDQIGIKTSSQAARIKQLSGGNQQKCIISRWLLTKPKVLLLDDPTRGIDDGEKADLYTLIDSLCQAGMAVVLTSSELPELLSLADRFIVMNEGRVTGEFSHDEATEQKLMAAATLG